jgi:hypothetical protein
LGLHLGMSVQEIIEDLPGIAFMSIEGWKSSEVVLRARLTALLAAKHMLA